ncbi:MAG: tRNA (cytidine(34)-2'-O)-methyltransferase, partial [Microcystaceae cyanobacterium]
GFSVGGRCNYIKFAFEEGDWLVFGSETEGLPKPILALCEETTYIPMKQPQVRSLNLSVSVAIGLFEAQRQLGYLD